MPPLQLVTKFTDVMLAYQPRYRTGISAGTRQGAADHSSAWIMGQCVRESIMEATENVRLPVIVDASSCTADTLLPRLETTQPADSMTIHPACSVVQLGIVRDVKKVARAAAKELHIRSACIAVVMPATAACSIRSSHSGNRAEAAHIKELGGQYQASTNLMCEMGMSRATGEDCHHVLEMLDHATC